MSETSVKALILAGGLSERMGEDKASLLWKGETLLERTHRVLVPLGFEVFVSVNRNQAGLSSFQRFRLLVDPVGALGPVGGLLAAFDEDPSSAWLAVSVDRPLLTTALLKRLLKNRREELNKPPRFDAFAFGFSLEGKSAPDPLCAVWEPSSQGVVRQAQKRGELSPRRILGEMRTFVLTPPVSGLEDVDTPQDWSRLGGTR